MTTDNIDQIINNTPLKGKISSQDILRWMQDERQSTQKIPLWVNVVFSLAVGLDTKRSSLEQLLYTCLEVYGNTVSHVPASERLYGTHIQRIGVDEVINLMTAATNALRDGQVEKSLTLWLQTMQHTLKQQFVIPEPYRAYGNLAMSAFADGNTFLAEAALHIALRLNPNYTFAQKLKERSDQGEFEGIAMRKAAQSSRFINMKTKDDYALLTNEELFDLLQRQGIEQDVNVFVTTSSGVRKNLNELIDKIVPQSDWDTIDIDEVGLICEVLWERLVSRPLFDSILDTLFDMEDADPGTMSHVTLVKKLTHQLVHADESAIKHFLEYPHELATLRYVLHNLFTVELLIESSVAEDLVKAGERLSKLDEFSDMRAINIIQNMRRGGGWKQQLKKLLSTASEHQQVIVMGITGGLLEVGRYQDVIDVYKDTWNKVLLGEILPSESEITSIQDAVVLAHRKLGLKDELKQMHKEARKIRTILERQQRQDSEKFREQRGLASYQIEKKLGKHPEIFEYEDFLTSLQVSFSTETPTIDKLTLLNPKQQVRVGRNEPCPCGSGKKHKRCHGSSNPPERLC